MGRMAGGRGWSQAEHNYAKNCYDTQSFCAPYFTFRFGSAFRLAFPGSPPSPSWMPSPILACLPSRSCRSRLPCGTSSSGALCTYFARITFLLYYLGQGCWLWSYFAPLTVFFWASSGLFCFALCMNAVLMFNIFFRASCLHLT